MAKNINDQDFEQEVLSSSTPVLVDFWAEWCGPCRQLIPIIDEISNEVSNLKVVKVNIDENPNSPQNYGVRGIPTMMVFKDGKLIDTKVGALPKSSILDWLKSHNIA
ncbi:thioredoxin [Rickettsiales endosymbiont of Stachyamoeba lipophora]|uniref:thioredoxin n=1 Tax=Rickettsiales endosymbiont of Stachyamoeba lipophora TaxID=2486578 RepID=UPI000F650E61|nr:thioredoxin [Rickettsiales endosymbiont of Stachyamoeba lipophora]AZL15515.1 thioredoxin [Rickettsiales endosymbiont of Stachyamoeba lipophora]